MQAHLLMKILAVTMAVGMLAGCGPNRRAPEAARDATRPSQAEQPERAADTLGEVGFQTSCDPEASEKLDRAVALLHHMMYEGAQRAFDEIAQRDPDCAMAHWGIATSLFHPLWTDQVAPKEYERGLKELERARDTQALTRRERAYIDATAAYFEGWDRVPEEERRRRWAAAYDQLHRDFPDDLDAAALHALALLGTAQPGDETRAHERAAAAILAQVYDREPRHPGAIHYAIHAHDNPEMARQGVRYANAYERIAPRIPHALHMPSHIFVRLGEWEQNNEWNRRSAAAALEHPADGRVSLHWPHAVDYLVYGYLQTFQDRRALDLLREMQEVDRYQQHLAGAYGLAAAHARYALERRQWQEAARLQAENVHPTFEWDRFPEARAVLLYARGVGAARAGDEETARRAHGELHQLALRLQNAAEGNPAARYWANRVAMQRDSVAAWIVLEEGDRQRAVSLMRQAADAEDDAGKSPVMPGYALPARELLGDMMLAIDEPAAALRAFEASLEVSPNRANALYGAARAARQLDHRELAERYYRQLLDLGRNAEVQRASLQEARRYLEAADDGRLGRAR